MGNSFGTHSYTFDGIPTSWAETLMQTPDMRLEIFVTLEEINKGCVKRARVTRLVQKLDAEPVREEKTVIVRIPAGCGEGTPIRFEKQGDHFLNKTPADIVFVVRQKPHSHFTRDGSDIHYTAKISLQQALRGKKLTVPSIQGNQIRVDTSGAVKPSTVKMVKGHGLPFPDNPLRRGKMYVRFDIETAAGQQQGDSAQEQLIPEKSSHSLDRNRGDWKKVKGWHRMPRDPTMKTAS